MKQSKHWRLLLLPLFMLGMMGGVAYAKTYILPPIIKGTPIRIPKPKPPGPPKPHFKGGSVIPIPLPPETPDADEMKKETERMRRELERLQRQQNR